jgi:hypothetical protein
MANDVETSKPFIKGRGEVYCRGCLGANLFSAINLGDLPIANELLIKKEHTAEKFPLHLRVCADCGLGQVGDVVTPNRIFENYRYLSSTSTTFIKHAKDFVEQIVKNETFSPTDWVLEIASNDGYLLKNFLAHGIKTVGVEPAQNIAKITEGYGIETISDFFSSTLANDILLRFGYPKLIIANNVMAHVPDLFDFVKGLSILCGDNTKISIENPSLSNILFEMQFDTIYHEHYSYLSAKSVSEVSMKNNLNLARVEKLSIHGGSNRYWLEKKRENLGINLSVQNAISAEVESGLFQEGEWLNYSIKVSKILNDFKDWLTTEIKETRNVYGYGAAAKASTLINAANIAPNLITAIADASYEKQGLFMPFHGINIISPKELSNSKPTDIIIFPWNLKNEITNSLKEILNAEVRLWCAIPEMHEVVT